MFYKICFVFLIALLLAIFVIEFVAVMIVLEMRPYVESAKRKAMIEAIR